MLRPEALEQVVRDRGRECLEQVEAPLVHLPHRPGDGAVVDGLVDQVARAALTDLQLDVEEKRPAETGLGPTLAIPKALKRAGLTVADVDLFEINEAFASMCVASTRILGIPHEITNVSGSGCSLGHPIAATGARMIVTLVHELRRRGGGIGVASMCAGGGMGSATVIEVPAG